MFTDPAFWALVGLLAFLAILYWKRVPALMLERLDSKIEQISAELEQARDLREKAQKKLAEAKRLQEVAEQEADKILAAARHEADIAAQKSRDELAASLQRRQKTAQLRIARAEEEAIIEIRNKAIDASLLIAKELLHQSMDESGHDQQLQKAIAKAQKAMQSRS